MLSEESAEQREAIQRDFDEHRRAAEEFRAVGMEAMAKAMAHDKITQGLRELHPWLDGDPPQNQMTFTISQPGPPIQAQGGWVRVPRPGVIPKPKGLAAVLAVLRSVRPEFYSAEDIHQMLVARGWETDDEPGAARTRASINRGWQTKALRRRRESGKGGRGVRYALAPERPPHPSDVEGDAPA